MVGSAMVRRKESVARIMIIQMAVTMMQTKLSTGIVLNASSISAFNVMKSMVPSIITMILRKCQ